MNEFELQHLPEAYRPLSPWSYFGLGILYSLPLVGWIFLIVHAIGSTNLNRRNYARSYFCVYVLAIILIAVLAVTGALSGLTQSLGAAAHLIHGSSDSRFSITYAVKEISQQEIKSVGFLSASYDELAKKYDPEKLHYGYNTVDGEEIYYIPNPALGLWINREKFEG